jgi:DNA-binding Lrp family transcriptional regulator
MSAWYACTAVPLDSALFPTLRALITGGPMANGVTAYVLIQTAVNSAQVAAEIRRIDGVESAEDVSGPYDVIVRASAPDMDQLGQLVVSKIQSVEGITRTLTCPIVTF